MKLRTVELRRFQQFIDEKIDLDPRVTVIVGRNDTGKTSFLRAFFDQHVYEGAIHGACRPRVPDFAGDPISFSLHWEVSPDDYRDFPLTAALGRHDVRSIDIQFQQHDPPTDDWSYLVNGQPFVANERGGRGGLDTRRLFPRPYYVSVSEGDSLPWPIEARFYDLPAGAMEALRIEDQLPIAALLLRIAGIRVETRVSTGRGTEEPWPPTPLPRPEMTLEEIERRLRAVSDRITERLRAWWQDPGLLTFSVRLGGNAGAKQYMHRTNSYGIVWDVRDSSGVELHSSGIRWFVTFLIKLTSVEDLERPFLLLLDEPATPLHPGAQRVVARMLDQLTSRHQVVCATHSPFLIDWNFPQRVRLFERDYHSQRTRIVNKPYRKESGRELIWDPLRESIGVTMGDLVVVGETNILVEGVTDQVLLAAASVALGSMGRPSLNLNKISIVPFSEEPALAYVVAKARAVAGRVVVLTDDDDQGRRVARSCERAGISTVSLGISATRERADTAIEDVIGVESYVGYVNAFYADLAWFKPITAPDVLRNIGSATLGNYLLDFFKSQFGQSFSKTGVAIAIADDMEALPVEVLNRFQTLIEASLRAAA